MSSKDRENFKESYKSARYCIVVYYIEKVLIIKNNSKLKLHRLKTM